MERLLERLDRLYAVGGGDGANRPGYTRAEDEAHDLVAGWMDEAGLVVERDPAGNLFGRRPGARRELAEVWTGSHLDSVPGGGRFDGALGVVAGLEAIGRLGPLERTLCVVAFRDEEGWRFGRGCTGSRALAGALEPGEIDAADAEGIPLGVAMGGVPPYGGWLEPPAAYVEAHVEQGPVLDRAGASLGIVSSISGLARLAVAFTGTPGHAGTTPMHGRADALVAASAMVLAVRAAAAALPGAVATVGQLAVEPNAANVIPARVTATIDARAPQETTLAELIRSVSLGAEEHEGVVEVLRRTAPVQMDPVVQAAVHDAAAELGIAAPDLASGAGHDAGVLAAAGVPSGMLFVRSRNSGVSHSPAEHSDPADVAACVAVLTRALERLASAP